MTTKDYKAATVKLNAFIHESKLLRDSEYRKFIAITKHMNKTMDDAIWGHAMPLFGAGDKPVAIAFQGFGFKPIAEGSIPHLLHI